MLKDWRHRIEREQDLCLPCGVKCLTTLRQTMIVDELTLSALCCAIARPNLAESEMQALHSSMSGRVARLAELRAAAAHVLAIADFYDLQERAKSATRWGGLSAFAGTATIITAFIL